MAVKFYNTKTVMVVKNCCVKNHEGKIMNYART